MGRRLGLTVCLAVATAGFGIVGGDYHGVVAAQPASVQVRTNGGLTAKESNVHLTSKTVVIDRTTMKQNLLGIAADGTFKFKTAAGNLAKLQAGKVMLLQGADALDVKGIKHSKGKFLVQTTPAQLTDVMSSGHISFSGTPNLQKVFLAKIVVPPVSLKKHAQRQAEVFSAPRYPFVGSGPQRVRKGAAPPTLTAQGGEGPFGYSISFTPTSSTRLDVSGTLCFLRGSICANGPASGVSAEVNLSGYIDSGDTSGGIKVNGGTITKSSLTLKGVKAHAHITYTVARGEGSSDNGDPPVFRLPLGVDYTIPGEVPIYLKLQTALLFKLGVSSKNAVIRGGVDAGTTGTESFTQDGKNISRSEQGDQVQAKILDQSDGGVKGSISAAPSGTVVAVQFPKFGMGLGWTSVNGIGYVDVVHSIGQETGAAYAGQFCSSFLDDESVGVGLEAQIGLGKLGLSVASQKKIVYDKVFKANDPGCKPISS